MRIRAKYANLDAFVKTWKEFDRKQGRLKDLEEQGFFFRSRTF
jgi:hypothetical protein